MSRSSAGGKNTVGCLMTSVRHDEVECSACWQVDNFRKNVQKGIDLESEPISIGSAVFYLSISSPQGSLSKEMKEVGVHINGPYGDCPAGKFHWEMSVEGNDGIIIVGAGGLQKTFNYCRLNLGPVSNIGKFLQSTGSLVLLCKLRLIPEDTISASSSSSLKHPETLARDYKNLLSSGEAADVTIRIKDERDFLVHKAILVARTPVFASMFRHQMSESETGVVNIKGCDADTFQRFLNFIYTGSVGDLCPENATEVYKVADKYQVDELKSQCRECVKEGLSVQLFCPAISLALKYSDTELTEWVTEFFADNVGDIGSSVQWQEFICKNPIQANELFLKAFEKNKAFDKKKRLREQRSKLPDNGFTPPVKKHKQ